MGDKIAVVQEELTQLLQRHGADESCRLIDDIVLQYIVRVVDGLQSDSVAPEPAFDVGEFTEMVEAHLPGFSCISSAEICCWMFGLPSRLEEACRSNDSFREASRSDHAPPNHSASHVGHGAVQSHHSATQSHHGATQPHHGASQSHISPPRHTPAPSSQHTSHHSPSSHPEARPYSSRPFIDRSIKSGAADRKSRRANRLRHLDSMVETAPIKTTNQPWAKMRPESSNATYTVDVEPRDGRSDFLASISQCRQKTAPSVMQFPFNMKRVRILSRVKDCSAGRGGVLYWMSRDQRVQDNWALLYAQKLALDLGVPLHVGFCLVPRFLEATIRHFRFMMTGLQEVEKECRDLDIAFHLLIGYAKDQVPQFVTSHKIAAVVCDFSPLRVPLDWVDGVKKGLPADVPLCQVDAHNVVPCWEASNQLEIQAYHFRPKMKKLLPEYFTEFPPVIKHPYRPANIPQCVDWRAADASLEVNRSIEEVTWAQPGTTAGLRVLEKFITQRLRTYEEDRNNPVRLANSDMSPWFHFGQVSAQRSGLMVKPYQKKYPSSVDKYLEQSIVRRELGDNFCYYNPKYDSFQGGPEWGRDTLLRHQHDKRDYLYSQEELEAAKTHDNLWNASQLQLLKDGKMHGFLRMYWAKKILEWTESPELALNIAIHLNDKYSLDGRDPNGYVGCMWSICGVHDHGFGERPVSGQIRWMSYHASLRKFDVPAFIKKYTGIHVTEEPPYPDHFKKRRGGKFSR